MYAMVDKFPSPTSLILVAVMNDPRDLEIARLLGWYRVPLRSAPKVIAVDYLAFYQTAAFGEEKWQVEYLAAVRGYELTTRAELLRDEPDHPAANLEYFKIQIGPLLHLPHPVLADRWRRITFLYTTGDRLMQAATINDLIVESEERRLLWQALRERAAGAQSYRSDKLAEFESLPPEVLDAFLGIKDARESYESISHAPKPD
jgi:hypothetical protein